MCAPALQTAVAAPGFAVLPAWCSQSQTEGTSPNEVPAPGTLSFLPGYAAMRLHPNTHPLSGGCFEYTWQCKKLQISTLGE